jgi:hypothetical protein
MLTRNGMALNFAVPISGWLSIASSISRKSRRSSYFTTSSRWHIWKALEVLSFALQESGLYGEVGYSMADDCCK